MADSYSLSIELELVLAALGGPSITVQKQTGIPRYSVTTLVLANGDNTITVPPGLPLYCLIVFDPSSGTTKKLKGVGGDTGLALGGSVPVIISIGAMATFIINSSAIDTGLYTKLVFF